MNLEIFGAWLAVFLTLAIFSFLYKDNPFYKLAEHLFVGISAGYWMSMFFWTQIQPNLFGRLWPANHYTDSGIWYGIYDLMSIVANSVFPDGGIDKGHDLHIIYLIPLILGTMMLLSVYKPFNWMARWGIAYTVGMAAGLRAYGYLSSNVLGQVKGTIMPLVNTEIPFFDLLGKSHFNNFIILLGTVTGLLYFYFSKEHKGIFGKITKTGIYFLMISFGASFGFAVMGRISLLIGRFVELIKYSGNEYHHATIWVLLLMVILLAYSAYKERETIEV
mgnify:CR=1 FL=1